MPQGRSTSDYVRELKNRALAATYAPRQGISLDSSTLTGVRVGRSSQVFQPLVGLAYDVSGCCCNHLTSVNLITDEYGFINSPYILLDPINGFTHAVDIAWEDVGATNYVLHVNSPVGYSIVYLTDTTAQIFFVEYPNNYSATVTATNLCSSVTSPESFPCFLAGSPVSLADGTTKPIEDIRVGDWLLGAFGEHNEVLALHRPLLGSAIMCRINNDHSTTNHHPHIGANKRIYCNDPSTVRTLTYGRDHPVINAAGETVMMRLHGLAADRIHQLNPGIVLKTVGGARTVTSLETYTLPPDTQLYNLVMGGSHTYHVDGYAVTGWPREDDWNYDGWMPKV